MTTQKNFAAALRASIEDEDAARKRNNPSRQKRRSASVKAAGKAVQRVAAPPRKRKAIAAKPMSVELSVTEALSLKQLRDALRGSGRAVRKNDLVRVAIALLAAEDPAGVAERLDALPRLTQPK